jgi:hypothetical protein
MYNKENTNEIILEADLIFLRPTQKSSRREKKKTKGYMCHPSHH